jgi:hypothetical protein
LPSLFAQHPITEPTNGLPTFQFRLLLIPCYENTVKMRMSFWICRFISPFALRSHQFSMLFSIVFAPVFKNGTHSLFIAL